LACRGRTVVLSLGCGSKQVVLLPTYLPLNKQELHNNVSTHLPVLSRDAFEWKLRSKLPQTPSPPSVPQQRARHWPQPSGATAPISSTRTSSLRAS
jgi:hypothetical protein